MDWQPTLPGRYDWCRTCAIDREYRGSWYPLVQQYLTSIGPHATSVERASCNAIQVPGGRQTHGLSRRTDVFSHVAVKRQRRPAQAIRL